VRISPADDRHAMSDFLKLMAAASAERAADVPRYRSADLDKPVVPLTLGGFELIAEIKARSPAEGRLAGAAQDRVARARQYATGGAAAISVLTEPSRFDGELSHLSEVAGAVPALPVMRKDFLVEPAQVLEARAAGASGVLLIACMLSDAKLRAMLDTAFEHGLFVLLESFDAADIERLHAFLTPRDLDAAAANRLLFGVNARDLRTLAVDPARLESLAARLPAGPTVAESGLRTAADAAAAALYGYTLALVGTALMRSEDPAALIGAMRRAGLAA
jgi:indole-3-glycerol phosphate synthase